MALGAWSCAMVACLGTASMLAVVARTQTDTFTTTIELRDDVTAEPLADLSPPAAGRGS